jgi:hypothetical protein
MVRRMALLVLVLVAVAHGRCAFAGVYSDDLGKCLVAHTGDQDRVDLVKWIFAAVSVHPAVRDYVSMTDAQRASFIETAAGLSMRLMTDDCHKETVAAIKYEGNAAIESAFELLGSISMKGLMTQADVAKTMSAVGTYFEKNEKLKALLREAGVAVKD